MPRGVKKVIERVYTPTDEERDQLEKTFTKLLNEKVTVSQNGVEQKVPKYEAIDLVQGLQVSTLRQAGKGLEAGDFGPRTSSLIEAGKKLAGMVPKVNGEDEG